MLNFGSKGIIITVTMRRNNDGVASDKAIESDPDREK